jgi:hypothetical protein
MVECVGKKGRFLTIEMAADMGISEAANAGAVNYTSSEVIHDRVKRAPQSKAKGGCK